MEHRLLDETGVDGGFLGGLFDAAFSDADRRELLAEAYQAMARKKAFRMKADDSSPDGTELDQENAEA
jgi:hypothetical protein